MPGDRFAGRKGAAGCPDSDAARPRSRDADDARRRTRDGRPVRLLSAGKASLEARAGRGIAA
jgi:hypothetical protein